MEKSGWGHAQSPYVEYIDIQEGTGGTETSQYLEEEKVNNDCGSSGERIRKSPNFQDFLLLILVGTECSIWIQCKEEASNERSRTDGTTSEQRSI